MVDTGHAEDPGVGDELCRTPGDKLIFWMILVRFVTL